MPLKSAPKTAEYRYVSSHVTIETPSRSDAELIAALLPPKAKPESWRGHGVIRLGRRSDSETAAVIETVGSAVEQHELAWARVRYDDDERVFRGNRRHAPRAEPSRRSQPSRHSPSESARPRSRRSLTDLVAELTRDWPSITEPGAPDESG